MRIEFGCTIHPRQHTSWPQLAKQACSASRYRLRRFKVDAPETVGGKLLAWFKDQLKEFKLVTTVALRCKAAELWATAQHAPSSGLLPSGWCARWCQRNGVRAYSVLRRVAVDMPTIKGRLQALHTWIDRLWAAFPRIRLVVNFDQVPWA